MEGCSVTSAGAVPDLPDGPLLEILSCVPAKSVCRFKCVSKAWRDLIADPDNRKKLRQPMQGLFLQRGEYSKAEDQLLFHISFIDLTVTSVPLDIDHCFSYLTEMTRIKTFFLDSCNGLVLFGHQQERCDPRYYTVCNPTTKEWSTVPACGSGGLLTNTYLAFAPELSSHFHLVQFQMPDVENKIVSLHVYSSETGIWSQNQIVEQKEQGQVDGWPHQFTLDIASKQLHAFVNGFLHVIVSCSDLQHILVVDVQGKSKRIIALSGMTDGRPENAFVCYLGQSQGHLHCLTLEYVDNFTYCELSTWVLQNYDTQEWVLKNTVDLNSLDVSGEIEETSLIYIVDNHVVDIHQDCNVVLFLRGFRKLIAYDMDRKEASVIATFKDHKDPWDFARYVPYFSESLDLPNKY